jgi:DNA-binding TFAR19-related protein (PDSD5 family)
MSEEPNSTPRSDEHDEIEKRLQRLEKSVVKLAQVIEATHAQPDTNAQRSALTAAALGQLSRVRVVKPPTSAAITVTVTTVTVTVTVTVTADDDRDILRPACW